MAIVRPFSGIHYNTRKIQDLSQVITPPYDNIPAGDEKKYLNRSPYNFAHLDLPKREGDDYSAAAELIQKWRASEILIAEPSPCFYIYRQTFSARGTTHSRDTLMCTVGLTDFSKAVVRPHENTYGKYKADRLQIQRRTQYNFSHIFAMVRDPEGFLKNFFERFLFNSPVLQAKGEDGMEHSLWKMPGEKTDPISDFFSDRPVYIVDGHHRYESALAYARELGVEEKWDRPAAHMLFCIANSFDPALVVFPTHRRLKAALPAGVKRADLERLFELSALSNDQLQTFVENPTPDPTFGLWFRGELLRATPKDWRSKQKDHGHSLNQLSVVWSDRVLLNQLCGVDDSNRAEKIEYDKDVTRLWDLRGNSELIIFHAPPSIESIANVADEKGFMPQKSTCFYPKIAAGLMVRSLL